MESVPARRHNPLRLVTACFGLALGGVILGSIIAFWVFLFVILPFGIELTDTTILVLSLVSLQGIAFPGIAIVYFRIKGRSLRQFVPVSLPGLREVGIILTAWVGVFLLVGVGATIVSTLAGSAPAQNSAGQTAAESSSPFSSC